ncbi:MAG: hypothetical protein Q7U91_09960 [Sideroxyarcus sp.]|nr:hypothetical protein [Sideroxyarcus sp.]
MNITKRRCFIAIMCCAPLLACSSVNGAASSKPKEEAKAPALRIDQTAGAATIKQVIDNAARMNDQQIELAGSFRGWKGCPSSAMITRSDWVLDDDSGCIYVSGAMPEGVSPEKAEGEHIRVIGRVVVDAKGKPAIKADRLIRLPN